MFAANTYTAGIVPGTADLTVTGSGGGHGTAKITLTGANLAGSVSVNANPEMLKTTETSTITAVLRDKYEIPMSNENVVFTTTLGTFSERPGLQTYTGTTDAAGVVTATLAAGAQAGLAVVYVQYGAENISDGTTIPITGIIACSSMTLSAESASIPADGDSTVGITATLLDVNGTPVPKGTAVGFTTTLGEFSADSKTVNTTTPGDSGIVTTYLTAANQMGTATVYVTSGNVSQFVSILFSGVGSPSIVLNADPSSGAVSSGPPEVEVTSQISAILKDAKGNPPPKGTTVNFTTTLGIFQNNAKTYSVVTPGTSGTVAVDLTSGTTPGVATVIGQYGNVSGDVTVTLSGRDAPGPVTLSANPGSIPADGTSQTLITALLKTTGGNPVDQGTSVTFTTSFGLFSNGLDTYDTTTGGTSGEATAYLVSDSTLGVATVWMESGNGSKAVSVTFEDTGTGSITVSAIPATIVRDGADATITALAKDFDGVPVEAGTTISFTTSLGLFSGSSTSNKDTPDNSGAASVALTPGADAGTAVVIAEVDDVSRGTTVGITGSDPGSITASVNPKYIVADGVSLTTVTVSIKDMYGLPVVKGTSVTFYTTLGTFPDGTGTYIMDTADDTGQVTISLRAGASVGVGTVVCTTTTGNVSATVSLPFILSQWLAPATINVKASPNAWPGNLGGFDGKNISIITAEVFDMNNNPVADKTMVNFSAIYGQLDVLTAETKDGVATAEYKTPGPLATPDADTITASTTNGVTGTANTYNNTSSVLSVTTTAITNIAATTATGGGDVTSDGGKTVTARGICWSTVSPPTIADPGKTIDSWGTGAFASSITGLTRNTLYYVRAYATNADGTEYGAVKSFTTLTTVPTVTTTAITNIAATTATSGGNVTDDGGATVTARGVCWSTANPPTIADSKTTDSSGTGAFTSSLTGLTANTVYYVRAYTTNAKGTGYGVVRPFTTSPIVTTTAVTDILATTAESGGTVSVDGGAAITVRGVCWSTINPPTIADSKTTDSSGTGAFTSSITGLTRNTLYYVRAYATNASGTGYGVVRSFTTLTTVPTVTTTAITNISATTATSGGNVTNDGGATVTARGVCWSTANPPTIADSKTTDSSGTGAFTSSLTGLTANTVYYVRAYATNARGTDYGAVVAFTSGSTIMTTAAVTNITATTATGGGTVSGGDPVTVRGVCWSTINPPTIADSKTTDGAGTGAFTSSLTGLTPNTVYYVRAYATNASGTGYGAVVSFTTSPTVTTTAVTNILATTATSGGNVSVDGGAAITVRGVCWSTINPPTIADSKTTDGAGTGAFTSSLTGLTPNTVYYVRAYATNASGTGYGGVETFTTNRIVTTTAVTNIDATTATSGGNVAVDAGAVTVRGVCWSTTNPPTISDAKTSDGTGTGAFVSSITGLLGNTTYYVRAYATNADGTWYGEVISFLTIP